MDRHQIIFTQPSIALIDTTVRAPIADKVLSGGDDTLVLHRLYYATGERFNKGRVGTIGFIGPAPPRVHGHCQCWCKNPIDACRAHLSCGCRGDGRRQLRITDRAQRDVMREYRGANHIIVAVDCISTPNDGDSSVAL